MNQFNKIATFIRDLYPGKEIIPLHEPLFVGNELKYLQECIDTNFVSSVGPFVDRFELMMEAYTGSKKAVVYIDWHKCIAYGVVIIGF